MAIASATLLRRLVRAAAVVWMVALSMSGMAWGQVQAMTGSVVPFYHSNQTPDINWNQIYKVLVTHNGNVLFLDAMAGAIYQLSPGSTVPTTLSAPGAVLKGNNSDWDTGMAVDSHDNLYITDRWGRNYLFFVPYNASAGTWNLNGTSLSPILSDKTNNLSSDLANAAGTDDIAIDDQDNVYLSTTTLEQIIRVPTDGNGNATGPDQILLSGLKAQVDRLGVDHAGNLYFLEDIFDATASDLMPGLWELTAAQIQSIVSSKTAMSGSGGSLEGKLTRVDPPAASQYFSGIAFDAAGNMFLSSATDGYLGTTAMLLEVPNTGTPTAPVFNTSFDAANEVWANTLMVAPVSATAAVGLDPRGMIWIPSVNGQGWTPNGSTALPGTQDVVEWLPGALNAGSAPVGNTAQTTPLFYNFSLPVTAGGVTLSQQGSVFALSNTNPYADPKATAPTPPCTSGKVYPALNYCMVFLTMNPAAVGSVSAGVTLQDSKGNLVKGASAVASGIGQGANAAILYPGAEQSGSNAKFQSPGQMAADAMGNVYIADSKAGAVFATYANMLTSITKLSIGGLLNPTGVAVDGAGNLYIADAGTGKVTMVPSVNGALSTGTPVVVQSGLGQNAANMLSVAVDPAGNVYIADQAGKRVVKHFNSLMESVATSSSLATLGSGFSGPTAIAADTMGNVFVADGVNLYELPAKGGQSLITQGLNSGVNGLAVDPSGSVYVSASGGVLRYPMGGSGLVLNQSVGVGTDTVTSPMGVTVDGMGNVYADAGTGSTALVLQVGVAGAVNIGQVAPNSPMGAEAQIFNMGNQSLNMTAGTVSGANAASFQLTAAGDSPNCDLTGATSLAAGISCFQGVQVQTSNLGQNAATVTIANNSINAPALPLSVQASIVVDNRNPTTTTVAYTPATGATYPANMSIAVTVAAQQSGNGIPTGQLVLQVSGHGSVSYVLTAADAGAHTFKIANMDGGTYKVMAVYQGIGKAGSGTNFAVSYVSSNFVVSPAPASVSVTAPPATYVKVNGTSSISVNVASTATLNGKTVIPSGNVVFKSVTASGEVVADPKQASLPLDGNGYVTFSLTNLPLGQYTLKAEYQGTGDFSAASSAGMVFQVINPSVLITTAQTTTTLTGGVPGTIPLVLTPLVGFSNQVLVKCVLPAGLTATECTFDNPEIGVGNNRATPNSPSAITVTISTNVPVNISSTKGMERNHAGMALAGLLGVGLLGMAARRRKFRRRLLGLACLLSLAALMSFSACTNSGYTKTPPAPHVVTPPGTYALGIETVDGLSGAVNSLPFTTSITVQ